jgi:hypothetical protein
LSSDLIDFVGRLGATPGDHLAPLAVIPFALQSNEEAKARFPGYRLSWLVGSRLDLDELDVACFVRLRSPWPKVKNGDDREHPIATARQEGDFRSCADVSALSAGSARILRLFTLTSFERD